MHLPAPYDTQWSDVAEDDGYDTGEFPNTAPTGAAVPEVSAFPPVELAPQWLRQLPFDPAQVTILAGAEVFVSDEELNPGTVVVAGGQIVGIFDGALPDPRQGFSYMDLSGQMLAPGFIDVHLHGMMGIDTNDASPADFQRLAVEAAQRGITALLPTSVACSPDELSRVLLHLHAVREQGTQGARLLGLHMESNFINPQFKGAQPPSQIFSPDEPRAWAIREQIDAYAADIRIITVAPEIPGVLELIPWLLERKIIVSMGHSAASYEQALAAIDAGATHATHLFNAMSPLHHRLPGLVGAVLESSQVFAEMVCDGIHVHPAVLSMAITAKGADRVMPVSDSLRGAGLASGTFTLGGQHVTIRDGVARLDDGTIAGSITTMDAMLRLLVGHVGWDLAEAMLMMSTVPADGLGLAKLGRIAHGAAADLVVLDNELQVRTTLVNGKVVFQR
jgi:N-acetylglucosamine-6-phosphate deacetylase